MMTNIEELLKRSEKWPALAASDGKLVRDLAAALRELLLARRALCVRLDELEAERDQLRAENLRIKDEIQRFARQVGPGSDNG